jgi:hypothetical protein
MWPKYGIDSIKKGYVEHVISTSNEWLMSVVIVIILATFYEDFKKLKVKHADVKIAPELDDGKISFFFRTRTLDQPHFFKLFIF